MSAIPQDAISLLIEDHERVGQRFDTFNRLPAHGAEAEKVALARQICTELAVHAQIEEELFYPAARAVLGDAQELMDEALVEHLMAKELIAAIAGMEAAQPLFDAKVKVLAEYVRHHLREEHEVMFPKVRGSALDLRALGDRLAQRREQLLDEFADVLGGAAARHPPRGIARRAAPVV